MLLSWHLWVILGILMLTGEIFTAVFFLACFAIGAFAAALLFSLGASLLRMPSNLCTRWRIYRKQLKILRKQRFAMCWEKWTLMNVWCPGRSSTAN